MEPPSYMQMVSSSLSVSPSLSTNATSVFVGVASNTVQTPLSVSVSALSETMVVTTVLSSSSLSVQHSSVSSYVGQGVFTLADGSGIVNFVFALWPGSK